MNIPSDKIFLLVLNLLTFTFDIILSKKSIIHIKIINIKASILHVSISCDNVFQISRYLSLRPWPSLEYMPIYILKGNFVSQTHCVFNKGPHPSPKGFYLCIYSLNTGKNLYVNFNLIYQIYFRNLCKSTT